MNFPILGWKSYFGCKARVQVRGYLRKWKNMYGHCINFKINKLIN